MRFSQLDDEYAAKLYEERFRQIQSDMMKKIQHKKNQQKKLVGNPRSSSSLGAYGVQQQTFLQGQSQLTVNQSGQLSTKNQTQRNQIMSKFQGAATQQGFMHQSTTLNGGSRLPTEDNNTQDTQPMHNFVPQKHKIKTQRSCELIVVNQNQSPSHHRSMEDNDIIYLNQGFPSPTQHKAQAGKYNFKNELQQNTSLGGQGTSYQKQNKALNTGINSVQNTQQSQPNSNQQRPFLSPPNKRTQQQNLKISAANSTQQGINRLEMSPSGRASTNIAMTTQGFYSPQANHSHHSTHTKFTNGAQTATNRRSQNDADTKRFIDRKKIENPTQGSNYLMASKHLNGSQTTTAAVAAGQQANISNLQFSNYANNNPNNSTNSYLIQQQNLRASVGFQGVNSSQSNTTGQYQIQPKNSNSTNNNNNNTTNQAQKKKDSTNINTNSKRSELEELDLRIQTIEREIERDNELAQQQQKKQSMQINPPSTAKNSYKPNSNKLYSNSPSHHISTDQGPQQSGTTRQSHYEKASSNTTTHKNSLNIYSPKQVYLSTDSAQQRKSLIYTTDTTEQTPINLKNGPIQSTKNQSKTQHEFNKLQVPLPDQVAYSYENSSYNNTPRSVNPIHDFRPFNKQFKKQVNFKSDNRMNTQDSQDERLGKYTPTSPSYSKNPSYPSPISLNNNTIGISSNELNLKNQINNQIQQQLNSGSRRNQQIHSNPPSQTRILNNNNTIVQYSINNQGSTQSLKFQKKLISGSQQQYSQNSNSNLQYQNSQEGTDEGDPEMSEFEYLEKIVNAKNTESSSIADEDTSIQQEVQLYGGYANNNKKQQQQQQAKQKKHQSSVSSKVKETPKVTPIKGQQGQRVQPNSNRESSSVQQVPPQSISVDSSPLQFPLSSIKQNKTNGGNSYLSLRQSDIIPTSISNTVQYRIDSPHIHAFQPASTTSSTTQKLQLKTLENNFLNTRDNTDQYSKHSNNSNNAHNSSSVSQSLSPSPVPMYNLYSQQNQVPSSASTQKSTNYQNLEKQIQKKMNRSSEVITKNSNNNNSNISNNNTANQNTNITRTPSVSSNNISTISMNTTPQIQGSGSTSSLNKGQLQMSNKQKNNPPVMMTHTLDTLKNKNDFKIKNSEQISRIINQDPIHSSLIRTEAPKKSSMKQARFEDEKEEYQLEQMSKNLHRKLNLLLETANQCNENIKSYRISHNN